MSSVFADGPRRGAKSKYFPSRLERRATRENTDRRAAPDSRVRSAVETARQSATEQAAATATQSGAEPATLRLVGESEAPAAPARSRPAISLSQLGSPLLLYIATALVVVVTGAWVVSDLSRRHRPIERTVVASTPASPAPVARSDGRALLPPARLGDGVVAPPPAELTAPSGPAETLNALMLRETVAPATPVGSAEAPTLPPAAVTAPPAPPVSNDATILPPATSAAEPVRTELVPPSQTLPSPIATEAAAATREFRCLLKVDGKVLFQRACSGEKSAARATLKLGDKELVVSLARGAAWQATFAGKSLGAVYPTGQCWGRRKQVYICAE